MTDNFWRSISLLAAIFLTTVALIITIVVAVQSIPERQPDPICASGHYEQRTNFIYINGTLIPIYDNTFVCDKWEKK